MRSISGSSSTSTASARYYPSFRPSRRETDERKLVFDERQQRRRIVVFSNSLAAVAARHPRRRMVTPARPRPATPGRTRRQRRRPGRVVMSENLTMKYPHYRIWEKIARRATFDIPLRKSVGCGTDSVVGPTRCGPTPVWDRLSSRSFPRGNGRRDRLESRSHTIRAAPVRKRFFSVGRPGYGGTHPRRLREDA